MIICALFRTTTTASAWPQKDVCFFGFEVHFSGKSLKSLRRMMFSFLVSRGSFLWQEFEKFAKDDVCFFGLERFISLARV